MKRFNKLLKVERVKKNMSQEELGEALNLTKAAISKWEKGTTPSNQKIREIEELLELPIGYFDENYREDPCHSLHIYNYATSELIKTVEIVEIPERYANQENYMCVRIEDDSLNRNFKKGSFAVFNVLDSEINNKITLLKANDVITVRKIIDNQDFTMLMPDSYNEAYQPIVINKKIKTDLTVFGTLVWSCTRWE